MATADSSVVAEASTGESLDVEATGKPELSLGKYWESDFARKLGGCARTEAVYDENLGVTSGVFWEFSQATRQAQTEWQEESMPPDFHLAIVVKAPRRQLPAEEVLRGSSQYSNGKCVVVRRQIRASSQGGIP